MRQLEVKGSRIKGMVKSSQMKEWRSLATKNQMEAPNSVVSGVEAPMMLDSTMGRKTECLEETLMVALALELASAMVCS